MRFASLDPPSSDSSNTSLDHTALCEDALFSLSTVKSKGAWSVELAGHLGTFLPFGSHRVLPALNGEILKR